MLRPWTYDDAFDIAYDAIPLGRVLKNAQTELRTNKFETMFGILFGQRFVFNEFHVVRFAESVLGLLLIDCRAHSADRVICIYVIVLKPLLNSPEFTFVRQSSRTLNIITFFKSWSLKFPMKPHFDTIKIIIA